MPFGIPSEDFHGGFGLPHDEFVEAYQNYMNEYKTDDNDDLSEKKCDELAQESYDSLVHSCIEAGGEIRELRRLLTIAKDDLLYLLLDGQGYREQLNSEGLVALSVLMNEYGMSKEKVDKDFKEISEYLERLEWKVFL